ncbi:MAG: hypothetical protein CMG71_07370 [Candidatus Marinimicrobia bacterium]|nr:hypothetical protein [Candidatus Neomarinimicrobiota bacterium]|tara:strand:- start:3850 stop:4347 length:498 start_codon:yes stop_codon:yes gene_type:complete
MKRILLMAILIASVASAQLGKAPPLRFQMTDGREALLQNFLDQGLLLIDYWALWCSPCLKKMPHLNKLQKEFEDEGLTILAVNLDSERSVSKVKSYVRSKGYTLPVALDPSQETYRMLNGIAMPYSLLIDQAGSILYRHSGYAPGDERILKEKIEAAFPASPSNS